MTHVAKSRNAFAILHEESKILRRKEKKERAEERKLLREELRQQKKEKLQERKSEAFKNMKWSEVYDDDEDEDEENLSHVASVDESGINQGVDDEDYEDDEEEEEDNDEDNEDNVEDEQDNEEEGSNEVSQKADNSLQKQKLRDEFPKKTKQKSRKHQHVENECHQNITMPSPGVLSPHNQAPDSRAVTTSILNHPLSKKEKIEHEKKQLEELHHLLKNYGLNVPSEDKDHPEEEKGNKVCRKKKKKKNDPPSSLAKATEASDQQKANHHENLNTEASFIESNPTAHAQSQQKASDSIEKESVSVDSGIPIQRTTISREELSATAKSKAVARRKVKTSASIISETVLAEAKKKSQLQKSKEKKDKSKNRY